MDHGATPHRAQACAAAVHIGQAIDRPPVIDPQPHRISCPAFHGDLLTEQSSPAPGFLQGLLASVPIVVGYFPIAFSFGVAASKAGFSPAEATFLSLVIFAGASQFVALALLTGGASLWISIATLLAMNVRHVFYAPALLDRIGASATRKRAWLWTFSLTDEVFGAAMGQLATHPGRWSERWMIGLGFAAYAAWVGGTAVGALLGGGALESMPALDAALGFMLPALFLALLLSIIERAQLGLILAAGFVCIMVSLTVSGTAGILAGMIAGALVGAAGWGRGREAGV